ncbi:RHS domain-containing protein [Siccationidurans soli]|uniref:RHS domain-containing protein n=1 Tax=Hymenobacter negativus TaxID=2795026 RepID=A0ABS3QFX9_9BACT|nr:RHS domain-containing protein [Hymenobacter negativus]
MAPVPMPLTVTSQSTVLLPGGLCATSFDELPLLNVPPFGVCAVTHVPCTYAPLPPGWSPVMETVEVGPLGGKALLEDSKIRCVVGGQISIYLTKAAALATLPDVVSQAFDSAYASLESVGPPFGGELRDTLGNAKGVWQGLYSLGEGLVSLAKMKAEFDQKVDNALLFAIAHPVEAAHAVAEGTQRAASAGWQAVTDKDNWLAAANVAENAIPGVLAVKGAVWLSDEQNRAKVGAAYAKAKAWEAGLTDYERSTIKGRVAFEVAALLVPETKLAKAAEGAKLAEGGEAAASGMRLLGEVKTGAKGADAAEAAQAPGKLEELFAGVKECFTEGHPVDVATGLLFTQATDFTLPGPLPLVWTRTWFSASTHRGALGHGWHHSYDLALMPTADGGATLRLADGRLAVFAAPAPGARSFNRRHKLELVQEATSWRVWSLRERLWYVFEPASSEMQQRLRAVENSNGVGIRFAYSPAGHLAALTDSAGRVLPCETDTAGRLLALHAPDPDLPGATFALVRYAYGEAGDLLASTDALGHAARFAYAGHLLTRETFRSGLNFYFEYDGSGPDARCTHTWGDGGIFDTRLRYNTPGHTTVWDSYGHQKEYFHQRGLVTHRQDALGAMQHWRYNEYAELEHYLDPLGQLTRYDHDGRGNQTAVAYPDGSKVASQFNALDLPVQGTDANGGTWHWQYDDHGQQTGRTLPTQATTQYAYDEGGKLLEVTDSLGYATRLRYDAHGNLAHTVTPDGSIRSREYDVLGRLIKLTDASGHVQRRRYDRAGQLTDVQMPDGSVRRFTYDAEGRVVRAEDGQQTIEYAHSPTGRVTLRQEAGQQVQFTYDLEGNLTGIINEQNDSHQFVLDAAGRVITETGFDGLTRHYERDAAGNVTRVQRPAARATTTYTYDPAGRITEVVYNEAERTSFRYRADGTLVEARNATSIVQFERDPLGRILREIQNGEAVTSSYDLGGRRVSLASSLHAAVSFERDDRGQVHRMQAGTWQSVIGRDAEGLEIQREMSGGIRTNWQRDGLGRLVSQRTTAGGGAPHQRRYHWQHTDQLAALEDSLAGTTQFAYDAWGNLEAAAYPDNAQELRHPDEAGNLFRTSTRTDRHYTKGGQLQQADNVRYKYDAEGNLIRKILPNGQQWRYDWDGAGQLACVTRPDGYAVTFTYDALGRRLSKRFRGRVTKWLWDRDKPLHEWTELEVGATASSAADVITWLFNEESFVPAAKLTAQGAYSIVCDHLGTPLTMYDGRGNATWEMTLDAYGAVRQGRGKPQDCPFRYQGQYEDTETGLYYNRFRYYDAEAGSYISQDPIGVQGGHRLYGYVLNPLHQLDILGLSECGIGTAEIHHSPGNELNPFGHYSVETRQISKSGEVTKVHTHQVITKRDYSATEVDIVMGQREGVTKSVEVALPKAEDAMKYQDKILGEQLGPYDKKTNSCVDHVCEVLREGGVDIPKTPLGQLKFLKSLGF